MRKNGIFSGESWLVLFSHAPVRRRGFWLQCVPVTVSLDSMPNRIIKRMHVRTVDSDGNQIGEGEWVQIPEPDHFATDGFQQIGGYVSRLLASRSGSASLLIHAFEQDRAFGLYSRDGHPQMSLLIDWRRHPDIERTIREAFERLGTTPIQDYLAGNGGVSDATRCLLYPVTDDRASLTELCKNILQRVYGVPSTSGLDFTYEAK